MSRTLCVMVVSALLSVIGCAASGDTESLRGRGLESADDQCEASEPGPNDTFNPVPGSEPAPDPNTPPVPVPAPDPNTPPLPGPPPGTPTVPAPPPPFGLSLAPPPIASASARCDTCCRGAGYTGAFSKEYCLGVFEDCWCGTPGAMVNAASFKCYSF